MTAVCPTPTCVYYIGHAGGCQARNGEPVARPGEAACAQIDELTAKCREVAELVSQWNEAALACDASLSVQPGENGREWGLRRSRAAGTASAYELCAAQLAACLARPPRPNADDAETDGEE